MSRYLRILLPILTTMALLTGAGAEALRRPTAASAEGYHRRIRAAQGTLPRTINGVHGDVWEGKDTLVPTAALELLNPNVIISRTYTRVRTEGNSTRESVCFLLVQSKDARDMHGHWPPRCYPANGWMVKGETQGVPMTWQGDGLRLEGKEYQFVQSFDSVEVKSTDAKEALVDDLLLLHGGRNPRDMWAVTKAAGGFRHCFGAAQVQVVFSDASMLPERRREIVEMLLTAARPLIDAIQAGGDKP